MSRPFLAFLVCASAFGVSSYPALAQEGPPPNRPDVEPHAEPKSDAKRGLLQKTAEATPGYTLIAPLRSSSTYLVDNDGHVVHEWKSDLPPGQSAYLRDDGKLLRSERPDNPVFQGGGQGGRLREFDWDGKVTWEYVLSDEKQCLHHDVKVLPNGNVLAIVWEMKSAEEARAAGRDPATSAQGVWADAIVEIEPVRPVGGKIVWEWHAFDHLVQARDAKLPNYAKIADRPDRIDVNAGAASRPSADDAAAERERLRGIGYVGGGDDGRPRGGRRGPGGGGPGGDSDWTHANGIDWRPDLDVVVLSSRSLSEVWVIDHSTATAEARTSSGGRHGHGGDLLFRYGNPTNHGAGTAADQKLWFQHDAQWIPAGFPGAGHLLVFNNGGAGREESSVDEIDLGLDVDRLKKGFDAAALSTVKLVWTYTAPEIRSGHISGVQRLSNGHTLIGAGEPGLVREVDATGKVVWDYASTLAGDLPMGGPGGPGGRGGPRGDRPAPGDAGGPPGDGGGPPSGGDPRRSGRRGGPGGMGGGPGSPYSFFRVDRYAPDHPALARLAAKTGDVR